VISIYTLRVGESSLTVKGKNSNFYDWIIWIAYRGESRKKTKFEIEKFAQCSSPIKACESLISPLWHRMQNIVEFDRRDGDEIHFHPKNCLLLLVSLFSSISIWFSHHNKHETSRSQRKSNRQKSFFGKYFTANTIETRNLNDGLMSIVVIS
jgi:hypothetical protein